MKDLIHIINKATTESCEFLKRPDETAVVRKSHMNPQFTEDIVRQVDREAYIFFKELLPGNTRILIRGESEESIHTYNVVAELETTFAELRTSLNASILQT